MIERGTHQRWHGYTSAICAKCSRMTICGKGRTSRVTRWLWFLVHNMRNGETAEIERHWMIPMVKGTFYHLRNLRESQGQGGNKGRTGKERRKEMARLCAGTHRRGDESPQQHSQGAECIGCIRMYRASHRAQRAHKSHRTPISSISVIMLQLFTAVWCPTSVTRVLSFRECSTHLYTVEEGTGWGLPQRLGMV